MDKNEILSEDEVKSLFMGLLRLVENNAKKKCSFENNNLELENRCVKLEKENKRLNILINEYLEKMRELRAQIVEMR